MIAQTLKNRALIYFIEACQLFNESEIVKRRSNVSNAGSVSRQSSAISTGTRKSQVSQMSENNSDDEEQY